jgi:hypothetical protein
MLPPMAVAEKEGFAVPAFAGGFCPFPQIPFGFPAWLAEETTPRLKLTVEVSAF